MRSNRPVVARRMTRLRIDRISNEILSGRSVAAAPSTHLGVTGYQMKLGITKRCEQLTLAWRAPQILISQLNAASTCTERVHLRSSEAVMMLPLCLDWRESHQNLMRVPVLLCIAYSIHPSEIMLERFDDFVVSQATSQVSIHLTGF